MKNQDLDEQWDMPIMCTSIAMKTSDFYFGRNMDIEYNFGERVVITPRNFPFLFRRAGYMKEHYAFMGSATISGGYPLYAEGVNEKGLCVAGLNFPGNAYYSEEMDPRKSNISPFELIPWLLGRCASLADARELLEETHIVAIPFSGQIPLVPLHWHIADVTGSIVLESTKEGTSIYENPVGVMTNNPPFHFQMENLCQYMNLIPGQPNNCFNQKLGLEPFGCGFGSIGLPGDFSPASRFVKVSYLLLNSICDKDEDSSISQMFHLLSTVSMVRGGVVMPGDKYELTSYSCCINADRKIYYYTTYSNCQITAIRLDRENLSRSDLIEYPLQQTQQIAWGN